MIQHDLNKVFPMLCIYVYVYIQIQSGSVSLSQIEKNKFVAECQKYWMEMSEANLNNFRSEIGKMSPV